jgi:hypothetical protein
MRLILTRASAADTSGLKSATSGFGPRSSWRGENEMRLDVTHDAELREAMIKTLFPRHSHALATPDEVATGSTRLQVATRRFS